MKNTLVIARRELAEKRFVVAAAFAFAVLSVLAPFVARAGQRAEAVTLTSVVFAVGFALGLATILGATIVGRDLSENRLSFYFARPVSTSSIWFGKLLGSAILIALSFAIIVIPALVAGIEKLHPWAPPAAAGVGVVAGAAMMLFFASHIIGTMVRSRSAWIALDFACAVATVFAVRAMLMASLLARAGTVAEVAVGAMAIGLAIVAVTAGAWQLARGRTDRRLSHIALSRYLWSGVTVILLIAAAYELWAMSVSPGDLSDVTGIQSGGWAVISGQAKLRGDYHPTLLVSVDGRRTLRMASPPWWGSPFSRDGRTAAWLQPMAVRGGTYELVRCRLDVTDPRPEPTGITTTQHELALSDDGARVLLGFGTYSIYELATARSLGSFRVDVPEHAWIVASFTARDVVRVYVMANRSAGATRVMAIYEYNLTSRVLRQTGTLDGSLRRISPDGRRMIVGHVGSDVARASDSGLILADARTGNSLSILGNESHSIAKFLADGSVAVTTQGQDGTLVLRRLTDDLARQQEVALGRYVYGNIVSGDAHRVLLELRNAPFPSPMSLAIVNLDRGVIERLNRPVSAVLAQHAQPIPAEVLCVTPTGQLVAWSTTTGTTRPIGG